MVKYWWASQGKNYRTAIRQKALWTCPRAPGKSTEKARMYIQSLEPGDIVFHHFRSSIRAVSRVTATWRDHRRPDGQKGLPGEGDDGWLVPVDPIRTDLELHYKRVAQLIRNGPGSPINAIGHPQEKFLFSLLKEEGEALLRELGVDVPDAAEDGLYGRPDEWSGTDTDETSLAEVRLEQADLRSHLLIGRPTAPCSICGEDRPARLLIAGHIKPRSHCTEEERKDFRSVAMLVCSLGCDALFGWGYVYVDPEGKVRRGIKAETAEVRDAVDLLIGKACGAYNEHTAPNFASHAELTGAN